MTDPTPTDEQAHEELDALDMHLSEAAPSPLTRVLHDIFDERAVRIRTGDGPEENNTEGAVNLVMQAEALITAARVTPLTRDDVLQAVERLIAALEVDTRFNGVQLAAPEEAQS